MRVQASSPPAESVAGERRLCTRRSGALGSDLGPDPGPAMDRSEPIVPRKIGQQEVLARASWRVKSGGSWDVSSG